MRAYNNGVSTTLRRALEKLAELPPPEQERVAETWLAGLIHEPEAETPREPFVIHARPFGMPRDLTPDHLDALAWGDKVELGYKTAE